MIKQAIKIFIYCFLICSVLPAVCLAQQVSTGSDTTFIDYPKEVLNAPHRSFPYHQTLVLKLFCSDALTDQKSKTRDNGKSVVYQTFQSALDVIRRVDALTLGIPKIVYLVGWQYNGHDSKYPAWFEVNARLKRPQDRTAIQSLRWLMEAAAAYHTTVSLHINMFDAYEDSPLWKEYLDHGLLHTKKDGSLLQYTWGHPISYAREWAAGYAQKRIDSLCKLLPIAKAGTIHIDAFHTYVPDEDTLKMNFDVDAEVAAQEHIFHYWQAKGIDVTSEFVDLFRKSPFAGLQPMAWWFGGRKEHYLKWPASYYCGGMDLNDTDWGRLFGSSMHGEDIIKADPVKLPGWKRQFCTGTVVWMFLNQLQRKFLVQTDTSRVVLFSTNVRSEMIGKHRRILQDKRLLVDGNDVLVPAVWIKNKVALIAYSYEGYTNRYWQLPASFQHTKWLTASVISQRGRAKAQALRVMKGKVKLTLQPDEMLLITN